MSICRWDQLQSSSGDRSPGLLRRLALARYAGSWDCSGPLTQNRSRQDGPTRSRSYSPQSSTRRGLYETWPAVLPQLLRLCRLLHLDAAFLRVDTRGVLDRAVASECCFAAHAIRQTMIQMPLKSPLKAEALADALAAAQAAPTRPVRCCSGASVLIDTPVPAGYRDVCHSSRGRDFRERNTKGLQWGRSDGRRAARPWFSDSCSRHCEKRTDRNSDYLYGVSVAQRGHPISRRTLP